MKKQETYLPSQSCFICRFIIDGLDLRGSGVSDRGDKETDAQEEVVLESKSKTTRTAFTSSTTMEILHQEQDRVTVSA
jgi:hypothetical protein